MFLFVHLFFPFSVVSYSTHKCNVGPVIPSNSPHTRVLDPHSRAMVDEYVPKEDDTDDQIVAKIDEVKRIAPIATDGKIYPQDAFDAGDEAKQGLMKVLYSLSQQDDWGKEMAKDGFYFKTTKILKSDVGIALLMFQDPKAKDAKKKTITAKKYLEEGTKPKEKKYYLALHLKATLNRISKKL